MRFNIRQIDIENFRSVQSKVKFMIKPGLYSIEGTNSDEKTNNGAGKSTIVSALYWCLTGNALTNEVLADDVVNIKTGKNCHVTVYIDSDQGDIKISRVRKDSELGNNLFLEICGQDLTCHKVADTQARINQLFRIPFDLLRSTILMTHDMKSAFSELTPQMRVQTLESIRDYSVWDKVRDEANKDIKSYNKDIQNLNMDLSSVIGSCDTYKKLSQSTAETYTTLQKSFSLDEIINKINKLSDENDTLIEQSTKILTDIHTFENQLNQYESNDLQKQLNEIVDSANNIKLNLQSTEYERKGLVNDIELIDSWFKNDRCPTCGHLLERTEEEKTSKINNREKLKESLKSLDDKTKKLNDDVLAKRKEWSEVNTKLQIVDKSKKEIKDKINELSNQDKQIQRKIADNKISIAQLQNERDSHNSRLTKLDEDIKNYTSEIGKLEEKQKDISAQIKVLEEKRQLSDYFYKLLSSKGELRPYLLKSDIMYLNQCMQKYIHLFFMNTEASLSLEGANIEISIESNNITKKISSLSGGEKKRLNIAIQLALYDLIKMTSQVSFNLLWLDEIESELDQAGVNQLIDIIEDKSDDIESVLWITNNPIVKENITHKYICTKSLGVTTVEEQ